MERSRRHCPGRASSRPPGRRPLGVFALRSGLAPSLPRCPAAVSLLLLRLLRFPLLLLFLVPLLLFLLLFPPPPPPQPPPPTAPTPLPPGHPGPCRVSGPLCLCCGPLDPKPAAPELMGLKHRRTRTLLHALSSAADVPWRPAPGSLRWLRVPGEGDKALQGNGRYEPNAEERKPPGSPKITSCCTAYNHPQLTCSSGPRTSLSVSKFSAVSRH
ncbi:uncharacterized protein LOC143439647 [Arvicanthis niloticus]|uniref:uncharacterized protein LOC143310827 n=1 Tax=Arvicanthis niloticus TaxID=61156 RepID=UPI00402B18DC